MKKNIILQILIFSICWQYITCQDNNKIERLRSDWYRLISESTDLETNISNIYRFADYNNSLPDSDKVKLNKLTPKLDSVSHLAHNAYLKMNETEFNQRLYSVLEEDPKNWRKTYDKLNWLDAKKQWYYLIEKHTDDLLSYVCFDYNKNDINKQILILINTPQNLKDSLLLLDDIDVKDRARLGDTVAENAIIKEYKESLANPTTDFNFLNSGEKLLYAGTDNCLRAYISGFDNNQILYFDQSKEKTAVLVFLLSQFHIYYPQVYITSNIKTSNHIDPHRWRLNGDHLFEVEAEYIKELEKYCLEEYGLDLNIDLPFLKVNIEKAYPH